MTKLKVIFVFLINLVFYSTLISQIDYISPKPGSLYNNPKTNIIIKFRESLKGDVDLKDLLKITGKDYKSYDYEYKLKGKTLLIYPKESFQLSDEINVIINSELKLENEFVINPFKFSFKISKALVLKDYSEEYVSSSYKNINTDIPDAFPSMRIIINEAPAQGKIFFYNVSELASDNNRFITILDNDGIPDYYRQENNIGLNFTLQPSGYMSFWNEGNFAIMDSTYTIIKTIGCGNGYIADWHDFIHLPNGHSVLFSYDTQFIDMSVIVEGGYDNALVEGLVIQELDEGGNVVFQWRSWDYFNILDAIDVDFTFKFFSCVHGNFIELDSDGNLLLSSRMLHEVTKIDMTTGEIIWRMGGNNNEFDFINDPGMFCRQHDVRRINNGNITLFDNGTCHPPSSAKEYKLDEINKTAELVWKYTKNTFSPVMGNAQRLENGNTFINWGQLENQSDASITEVDSDNNIVFEIYFDDFNIIYRSHRYKWGDDSYTSITDNLADNKYCNIFPNPTKDIIHIQLSDNQSKVSSISIYDINGRLIKNFDYEIENKELLSLNVNDLNEGLYFLKIQTDKQIITEQIVISK
ncbi:MAG: aryl-sulfate sulfotransferase [Bacteroidales bacterium]|nr:aryl-sulfate sulfotransferase [Bacteroidales bacterium]